jgi:hypothetical protein
MDVPASRGDEMRLLEMDMADDVRSCEQKVEIQMMQITVVL